MSTFLISVIGLKPNEGQIKDLASAINSKFSEQLRFSVNPCTWFVKFDGSPRELSLFLGTQAGGLGSVIISEVIAISGYGPSTLTNWYKENSEKEGDNNVE